MLLGTIIALTCSLVSLSLAGPYNPYEEAGHLEIHLAGSGNSVSSVDNIIISATVKNAGREPVNVIRYGSILDNESLIQSFNVTKDGAPVKFTGREVFLTSELDGSAITAIPAGGSITVNQDVAGLYDFESAGTGVYSFEPLNTILVAVKNTTKYTAAVSTFSIRATTDIAHVQVISNSGDIITSRQTSTVNLSRRAINATTVCNDEEKRNKIQSSYNEAKILAKYAAIYVQFHQYDRLFETYFGIASITQVTSIFKNIMTENNGRTLNCDDPTQKCAIPTPSKSMPIAYKSPTNDIYYCPIFFKSDYVPTDSLCTGTTVDSEDAQGGVTLHELVHATSTVKDLSDGEGCVNSRNLAEDKKELNADNYSCFATQAYKILKCKESWP